MKAEQIIIEPIITEKSTAERASGRYVFKVHLDATKIDIKRAVYEVFKVKVKAVNTCKVLGKPRIRGRMIGKTSSWKKAYVTLFPGERIEKLEA